MQLHHAAARGDPHKLRTMTAKLTADELGFNDTSFRSSPLSTAVLHRQLEAVRMLIDAGASVNARDKFGCTPLHIACRIDDEALVKLLLQRNADPTATNRRQLTPLDYNLPHRNPAISRMCHEACRAAAHGTRTDSKVQSHQLSNVMPLIFERYH